MIFLKKIVIWQDAYIDKLNKQYIELLNSDKSAAEKFWELENRIYKDKKQSGVECEISRTTMLRNILNLLTEDVITLDDLKDFSDDLQSKVKNIIEIDNLYTGE